MELLKVSKDKRALKFIKKRVSFPKSWVSFFFSSAGVVAAHANVAASSALR